jgi:hypothetical protein
VTRARLGALLLLVATVGLVGSASSAQVNEDPGEVFVFLVPGVSFEEMLAVPEIASLATAGGAALMTLHGGLPTQGEAGIAPGPQNVHFRWLDPVDEGGLDGVATTIVETVASSTREAVQVFVASTTPSAEMLRDKDELHPLVIGSGSPTTLFAERSEGGSLTSGSTRRAGVVTDLDVVPSIAEFMGVDPPVDATGAPIEIIEGPPPFELHERYLAQRRMYIPIGAAAATYVIGFGLVAAAFLAVGQRVGVRWRRVAGWISLSVAMLAVGLLAAGHLPELTYATVVPFIALVTAFGTLAFAPLERRDVLLVPAGIGLAVLGFFVVEAALGWSAMLTPFVGGSQLDGGRFYGMPNVSIGLLVGACFWVAQRLRTVAGVWLLVGAALFAGSPFLGANLGGAATLFAGAGLWVAVRERERLGTWKGLAVFLGFTLVGTALILLVHAISPIETHVTRFEEQVSGLGGVLQEFTDRLQVGFDLIARNPLALIPVLGLPVAILAVVRPPSALRPSLERSPAWRDAILATLLTGVVAYVLNDSGPAAAGFAFGLGLGGLLGVSLLLGAGKMVDR